MSRRRVLLPNPRYYSPHPYGPDVNAQCKCTRANDTESEREAEREGEEEEEDDVTAAPETEAVRSVRPPRPPQVLDHYSRVGGPHLGHSLRTVTRGGVSLLAALPPPKGGLVAGEIDGAED